MKQKIKRTKKSKPWMWLLKIFMLAITLSLSFSLLSELTLSNTSIAIAIIVIVFFIVVSIFFDMLGMAVATCPIQPFTAMASKKVKGAQLAITVIKNSDKVSAICADVIGDVCGILSGAAGASIVTKIIMESNGSFLSIFIPSLISSIIAGLTILGKATFKKTAQKNAIPITLKLGKFLRIFKREK